MTERASSPKHSNYRWRRFLGALEDGHVRPLPETLARAVRVQSEQVKPLLSLEAVGALWPDLSIRHENLDGAGYLLDLGALGGEILVRRQDGVERQRFTIAHELGHWLLGLEQPDISTRSYRSDSRAKASIADHRNASVERWCDLFASELLVPTDWVKNLGTLEIAELPLQLLRMPHVFGVSRPVAWFQAAQVARMAIAWSTPKAATTFHMPRDIPPRVRAEIVRLAGTREPSARHLELGDSEYGMWVRARKLGTQSVLTVLVDNGDWALF